MAWARIDDKFLDNPKVRKAGKEATYLYIAALIYASSQLTDGSIDDETLALIAFKGWIKDPIICAKKLIECELWDRVEGGYIIHDYHDYNPTKQEIDEARAKKAYAGSKGGTSRWQANVKQTDSKCYSKTIADAITTSIANDKQTDNISPSHPIPSPTPLKEQEAAAAFSGNSDVSEAVKAYEKHIGVATPGTLALINTAVADHPSGWVEDAIREAAGNNARSWNYVAAILKRWKAEGRGNNGHKKVQSGSYEFWKACEL